MGFFKRSKEELSHEAEALEGLYTGPVGFDGKDFYAVAVLPNGEHELTTTRLKSVGEEFHYAQAGDLPHNEIHGKLVVALPVGGEG